MMEATVNRPAPRRPERLFVSTTPGLEPALAGEVAALGAAGVRPVEGGVEAEGPAGLHRRANLHLRTASRVLLRVGTFPAPTPDALDAGLSRLPLEDLVDPARGAVLVGADSVRSAAGPRDLEAAAARMLGLRSERRGDPEEEGAEEGPLGVSLRVERDVCTASVDTSGALLYRRGYRQEVSRAPLRETLAAGVLGLAGYTGEEPLVDPMCGSGTFLVEGAWLSLRRAPGLSRTFAFEGFPSHDARAWEAERRAAQAAERPAPAPLFGSDLNAGALGTARRNARRAGVQEHLVLERRDVAELVPPPVLAGRAGLVVVNPPYGKRVGEGGDLPALYRALGEALRTRFGGWRAAVLVPEEALARALGFPSPARHAVENGGLPLQLLVQRL